MNYFWGILSEKVAARIWNAVIDFHYLIGFFFSFKYVIRFMYYINQNGATSYIPKMALGVSTILFNVGLALFGSNYSHDPFNIHSYSC